MKDDYTFITDWIRALIKVCPDRMTEEEYLHIVGIIREQRPCDVLVFGVGRDMPLWALTNFQGKTVYLEDDDLWLAHAVDHFSSMSEHIFKVVYTTTIAEHGKCEDMDKLMLQNLPEGNWRVIIVDGPNGSKPEDPGRMQSIFTAAALSNDTHVFIHDCDREIEQFHADFWFREDPLVYETEKLRHYYVAKDSVIAEIPVD